MDKETKYDSEITELESQEADIGGKIHNLRQLRAEHLCPHTVGEIITNKKGDRKAKIARIKAGYGDYAMLGYWLKKDGSLGSQLRELYWFEWE